MNAYIHYVVFPTLSFENGITSRATIYIKLNHINVGTDAE